MSKIPRSERYSLWWRLRWNVEYGLMQVYGPAHLDDARDPRVHMRRDHDRRKAAHEARRRARTAPSVP